MNPSFLKCCTSLLVAIPGLLALALAPQEARADFTPATTTFESNAVLVRVDPGVRRIRLRQWNATFATWELLQIAHLQGESGYLKLRVPDGASMETIKVDVSSTDPFPHAFYSGKSRFGQETASDGSAAGTNPGMVFRGGAGLTEVNDTVGVVTEVVESDIWKIVGDRLYFFNHMRGLQLFDLSADDAPAKLASLRLPGVGEQMYVLDDRYTILLAAWRSWDQSEIVVTEFDAANGLRAAQRLPLPGTIVESRLIGRQLYVVTRFSEQSFVEGPGAGGNTEGRWVVRSGLNLSVFDFTDPANPVEKPGLQLAEQDSWGFYHAHVAATSTHLLVAPTGVGGSFSKSRVFVIDIADQMKDPALVAEVPLEGDVASKFQLRVQDDVLTTVSQVIDWTNRRFETVVETFQFDASAPGGFTSLDDVALGFGERLFATRFHGDRLYVVTFAQIDPFWVLDVGDPRQLEILGELEVPGFSRYLEPWGDNVVAIGVEDNVVTASLFNATDPRQPTLLSRVRLGEGASWSEANYDEKAVHFDPDRGLLLVPYDSWSNGVAERNVQIIDVTSTALTKRGVIEHNVTPRRAGLHGENIVSVSPHELVVVAAADRDHPVELSRTIIAWNADRIFNAGDYLVQVEEGGDWDGAPPGTLRVTTIVDPDTVVAGLPLGRGMIVGAVQRDPFLHVLRSRFDRVTVADESGHDVVHTERTLVSTIIDLTDPTAPQVLGEAHTVGATNEQWYYGTTDMKALWLPGGELAWVTANAGANWWHWGVLDNGVVTGFLPREFLFYQPLAEVHAVDVADPSAPVFLSSTRINHERSWSYSPGFLVGENQVGFTYETSVRLETENRYLQGHTLRVVDLTDPVSPHVSNGISVPGTLSSVIATGSGAVLLTESRHSAVEETPIENWGRDGYLQASVFDGANTFLLAEVKLPNATGVSVYEGATSFHQLAGSSTDLHLLGHVWNSQTGEFDAASSLALPGWQSQLEIRDDLLLAWQLPTALTAIDISQPLEPAAPRVFAFGANLWGRIDDALVDRDVGAWFPTGAFGVEFVDFAGTFSAAGGSSVPGLRTMVAAMSTAPAEPEWREVPDSTIVVVSAEASDFVGSLTESGWRYAPAPEPVTPTVEAGGSVTLSVPLTGTPQPTCQWQLDGVDIPGATGSSYTIPSAQRFHRGEYTVVVSSSGGSLTLAAATVTVNAPAPSDARLLNLSARGFTRGGETMLLPGFVVSGTGTKKLLLRAVGPTLTDLGLPLAVIPDPTLKLRRLDFSQDPPVYVDVSSNDDWQSNGNAPQIVTTAADVGAFALTQDADAALLVDLPAGQYSVLAGDKNDSSGIAIVELYEADDDNPGTRLVNISNRGYVGVGDEVMIPGFVVSREGSRTFLIRVVGPSLAGFGVKETLSDPKLALFREGDSDPLLSSDDWSSNPDAAFTAQTAIQVSAFPLESGSKDAAVVVTLPPGVYTVIGSSADDIGTGIALVEVYLVP